MSEKSEHALELIDDLLSHNRRPTFCQIQDQLERHSLHCSQKTVYRYLEELKKNNAPLAKDPDTGEYYYSVETYRLKNNRITPRDQIRIASQVKSLLETIKDTPVYDQANKLLTDLTTVYTDSDIDDYLSKNEKNMDLDSDTVIFLGPPVADMNKDIWYSIYNAIHKRQIIDFYYQSQEKKEYEKKVIAPYQLIFEHGNWNVWGYNYKDKENRLYTVSHMKNFALHNNGKDSFNVPEDFDFRKITTGAFGCYTTQNWKKYSFILKEYAKRNAEGRIFGLEQTVKDNGDDSVTLTFKSNQIKPILSWALSWGKNCIVLEPPEAVIEWKENINIMLKNSELI